jgi:tetratricopeptide (TPR) repeat protein
LCQHALGELLRAIGRAREAETAFEEVDRLTDDLLTDHVPSPAHGINLCSMRAERVERLLRAGRLPEAETMCRKSMPMAEKLARAYPDNHRFRHYVALCDEGLGMALAERSRPDEAERACRRALAAWTALMTEFPKNSEYRWALAQCHGDLADLLTTGPAKHYWNAVQALQLARRAIELQPDKHSYWNTLGTAHYRAGDWNASVRVLEMSAFTHGDCQNWFFLAMANWQQRRKDKGRDWYQRAREWMATNAGKLDEDKGTQARFRRFRAETEELMGIALPANDQKQVK